MLGAPNQGSTAPTRQKLCCDGNGTQYVVESPCAATAGSRVTQGPWCPRVRPSMKYVRPGWEVHVRQHCVGLAVTREMRHEGSCWACWALNSKKRTLAPSLES